MLFPNIVTQAIDNTLNAASPAIANKLLGGIIGGGAGAIGGIFNARQANKNAEATMRNTNKTNQYKHKFGRASWETEKQPYYRGRDRSRSLRNQVLAGLMKNPNYGLSKLFPGFANFSKEWTGGQPAGTDLTPRQYTQNTFDAAGPPPEMEAVGKQSMMGGMMGGLASGAKAGAEIGGLF